MQAVLCSYVALSESLGLLLGKAHVQTAQQLPHYELHSEHQVILFTNCTLTKNVGVNFIRIKKTRFQFFLLHNWGTWASVIKQCAGWRMLALSTSFSLWHQRETERIESKKPNNIQESTKVIKADSLILLYTYFSKKGYISKHSISVLDANKQSLFSFTLW